MRQKDSSQNRAGRIFIVALVLLVVAMFLVMIRNYLIALILAAIIAGLLMPSHRWISRKMHGHRNLSAAVVLVLLVLIIGIPLLGIGALVTNEAIKVGNMIAPWVTKQIQEGSTLQDLLQSLPFSDRLEPFMESIIARIGQFGSSLGNLIVSNIPNLTKGTINISLNIFIFLYALYYFLIHGSDTVSRLQEYLPLQERDSELILERGVTVIRASLKGILVIGVLQGVLIALAFWIIGIPGAAFWGAVVVILSAIPGVGTPLIWLPAAIYLFSIGQTGWAIGLIAWGFLVVGLIDNILRPVVVGRGAKLPDLLILVSILGGLSLFGASGILIGPVIAALVVTALDIYRQIFSRELDRSADRADSTEQQ